MNWEDQGLVLSVRPHGETAVVLEAMTRRHGRHLGLVHGGRSRRMRPVLQPGNTAALTWRARLDEQLGSFTVEPETLRTERLLGSALALAGISTLASHLRLLPERDPHPDLFEAAAELSDDLSEPGRAAPAMARFELVLLAELGFGLDLASCAATGSPEDLGFVSPRTGRAVSRAAAAPYRERLLALPAFLAEPESGPLPSSEDLAAAFRLTGFFLDAHAYGRRDLASPEPRERFVAMAVRPRAEPAKLAEEIDARTDSRRDGTS